MSIMRGVGGEVVRLLDRVGTQWSVGVGGCCGHFGSERCLFVLGCL